MDEQFITVRIHTLLSLDRYDKQENYIFLNIFICNYKYIKKYFQETEASALAAGSIFVYYGPHNAVLINYPNYDEKKQLLNY